MLQIRKTNSRSHRTCRSSFQLFQPLSYETLDFHNVKHTQHALLSNPRAVTLLVSMHKNYAKQLCAIPRREYTFLSYCRSRPRGVAKHRNRVLTLSAVHFFCAWRPRCASHFRSLQPLSCENAISAHARCECVAGVQVFHLWHRFATPRLCACKIEW